MFYETAQTIGPGWHSRSYRPAHYEDMAWSPSSQHFRSPGDSPITHRRIIRHDSQDDSSSPMFGDSPPSFRGRFFKDAWNGPSDEDERFMDRPRMFKRVVQQHRWDDDDDFDSSRCERSNPIDSEEADIDSGRVHHIPIMVERRRESEKPTTRSHTQASPPTSEQENFSESEKWCGPQVHRLWKKFEPQQDNSGHFYHRVPRIDPNSRPRAFTSPIPTWDPQSVHTLPTRRGNKVILEDNRTPKSVFRSYSETHEDLPRQQHPTAFRSHSDSHCPRQTYVTKISVNVPAENTEKPTAKPEEEQQPLRPRRRRDHQQQEMQQEYEEEQPQYVPRQRQRQRENAQQQQQDDQQQQQEDQQQQQWHDQQREYPHPQQQPEYKEQREEHQRDEQQQQEEDREPEQSNDATNEKTNETRVPPALQQIAAVLQNVEDLKRHVEAYSGNGRDKQYRFLDEMLTRCILRLDDVDTEGREDLRSSRKAAVRQVQACIEKLESKAEEKENKAENPSDSQQENGEEGIEGDVVEKEDVREDQKEVGEKNSCPGETMNGGGGEEYEQTKL